MSKRIMSEVFCLAEDNGIDLFYQDTDSCHMLSDDVPRLAELFRAKYGRELVGTNLGQFHTDFISLDGTESYAVKSVFCGKKIYIDKLTNDNGVVAYHARMKGVKQDVVAVTANKRYPELDPVESRNGLFWPQGKNKSSIMQLYEDLYAGIPIEFDLCSGSAPCFDMKSDFSITTKTSFVRKIIC
jgi:hypothetical protein